MSDISLDIRGYFLIKVIMDLSLRREKYNRSQNTLMNDSITYVKIVNHLDISPFHRIDDKSFGDFTILRSRCGIKATLC